jgi:hypothetical protein
LAVFLDKDEKQAINGNTSTGKSKQQQQQENPMIAFMYGLKRQKDSILVDIGSFLISRWRHLARTTLA